MIYIQPNLGLVLLSSGNIDPQRVLHDRAMPNVTRAFIFTRG